jgi:hypothetical protein
MADLAADPREWTAGQLMGLVAVAIVARDFETVPHLITLLAFKDPHLAETVHDSMLAVLSIGRQNAATEGKGT